MKKYVWTLLAGLVLGVVLVCALAWTLYPRSGLILIQHKEYTAMRENHHQLADLQIKTQKETAQAKEEAFNAGAQKVKAEMEQQIAANKTKITQEINQMASITAKTTLRGDAHADSLAVLELAAGEKVEIKGQSNQSETIDGKEVFWLHIRTANQVNGYVLQSHVKADEVAQAASAVQAASTPKTASAVQTGSLTPQRDSLKKEK